MKKISLICILISLTACTGAHYNRPVQDQVVGGTSILDAFTGRDRIGVITKQAHYDIFISRPVPSTKWFADIPILNMFDKPSGYEICQAPPADAMAATASALAAAISVKAESTSSPVSGEVAGSLATSFANKVKAFSIRTQGIQYLRDVRFNNCIAWQNRGELDENQKLELQKKIIEANSKADKIGERLILQELMLRALTNNFGVSNVEISKEEFQAMLSEMDARITKAKELMDSIKATEDSPAPAGG